MPPKAYSSFFFQLPNVPNPPPPLPSPGSSYLKAHQDQPFRGKSFLSFDNADSLRDASIEGDEEEGGQAANVDPEGKDTESVWTAFTRSSGPSSFVIGQAAYATRTRPVLATLDTKPHHHHCACPSSASSSRSLPKAKPTPTSTVLPTPPVLPELPPTPSLSLPFDFDVNNTAPFSAPVTKTVYPTLHSSPPKSKSKSKSTAVSPSAPPPPPTPTPVSAPVSPPRLKTSLKPSPPVTPVAKPRPAPITKPVHVQSTPLKSKPNSKTSRQPSTPRPPRPVTEPQPRRQRPLSTSTVSTHYRMVRRADALACLEGKREPEIGVGAGLVKSAIISAKPAASRWAAYDVKSFMPLDDTSDDDEKADLNVQVVGVRVRGRRPRRGTIDSWYVGPADAEGGEGERKESRFSSASQSPISSRSTSPSPSPSSGSSMHVYHGRAREININFPTSVSAKSSPRLASVKPAGNFIDLDFEGDGDIYEYWQR